MSHNTTSRKVSESTQQFGLKGISDIEKRKKKLSEHRQWHVTFLKFAGILALTMVVTYFLAGLLARFGLGGSEFYPPSPNAISYLKDPAAPGMAQLIWPAQAIRGILFAIALFPLRRRFIELGTWRGGFALGLVIFIIGFVAASGGMIEHFVWFNEYPIKFAAITFIEILFQVAIMGPLSVYGMKKIIPNE